MLTKVLTAVLLSGALWVAGDAAYQKLGCCFPTSECCDPPRECCFDAENQSSSSSCCSTKSSCCDAPSRSSLTAKKSCCSEANPVQCCDAAIVYCTRTG